MNKKTISNMASFVSLVFFQIFICNQLNFLDNINPFIYVLFIILYPIGFKKSWFIFTAFTLGLTIDLFLDTGGAHAAASVSAAYFRPLFLKFSFGAAYEYQSIKINNSELTQRLVYFSCLVFFHHLLLFTLVFFDAGKLELIIYRTLVVGFSSLILALLLNTLFNKN